MSSLVDRIRSCDYLYLGALTEPRVNELRIVLLEAQAGSPIEAETLASEYDPVLRSILVGSRKIEHFPDTSVAVGDRRRFAEYSSSHYLDYLTKASFTSQDYPGPYRHWALYCEDHTIDIASQVDPLIREIGPA